MGRGLSTLQKTILSVAADSAQADKKQKESLEDAYQESLSTESWLADHFKNMLSNQTPIHYYQTNSQHIYHHHYGIPCVSTEDGLKVTEPPSNGVKVSVSRAFKRLCERGLMKPNGKHKGEFQLTAEGLQKAIDLMVDEKPVVSSC